MLQAAELEQQSDIASAGTMHNLASSTSADVYKSASLIRQSTRAQRSFMQSTEVPQGVTRTAAANLHPLHFLEIVSVSAECSQGICMMQRHVMKLQSYQH